MNDGLRSLLPSATVLGLAAVIALFLTLSRNWAHDNKPLMRGAIRLTVVTILFQSAHFTEELVTGFHEQFPALLDLPPMPVRVFVVFNLAWLMIWSLSAWGLAAQRRVVCSLSGFWALGARVPALVSWTSGSLLQAALGVRS